MKVRSRIKIMMKASRHRREVIKMGVWFSG